MLNTNYDMTLNILLDTNEELADKIKTFVSNIPAPLLKKIQKIEKEGRSAKGNNMWVYYEDGKSMSISVGDKNNYNKDYMSLSLCRLDKNNVRELGISRGEEYLGYVVFYLNGQKRKEKPYQLTYNFYLKKIKNTYCVIIQSERNTYMSDFSALIESNGLTPVAESIANSTGVYPINVMDKIMKSSIRK